MFQAREKLPKMLDITGAIWIPALLFSTFCQVWYSMVPMNIKYKSSKIRTLQTKQLLYRFRFGTLPQLVVLTHDNQCSGYVKFWCEFESSDP
jgi:hypothetical protein